MSRFERLDGEKISKEAQKKSEWQATNPLRRSVERKGCAVCCDEVKGTRATWHLNPNSALLQQLSHVFNVV